MKRTDSKRGDARWSEWDSRWRSFRAPPGAGCGCLLSAAGRLELSSALSACRSRVELPQPRPPRSERCDVRLTSSRAG